MYDDCAKDDEAKPAAPEPAAKSKREPPPKQDVVMQDGEQPREELASEPSGPAAGPSMPQQESNDTLANESAAQSPYATTQAAIRNLTMPSVPNFDVPDSPPGSPPPQVTKRFAHFLELKKKGVHFNTKLETSPALRNPALLQKLMDFAGVDEYDQYASALPDDLAIPTSYPPWAYGDQLNKTQQQLLKRKDAEKAKIPREKIDFVGTSESSGPERPTTTHIGAGRSAAERVMAGLNREQDKLSPKPNDRRRTNDRRERR